MLEIIDEIRPRRQERASLRRIVMAVYNAIGALCLLFLFALAATWPTNANADDVLIAKFGQLTVTLYQKPCTNADVLKQLEERVHQTYRAGEADHATLGHRNLCYLSVAEYKHIFVLDEKGGMADLPKAAFRPFGTGV